MKVAAVQLLITSAAVLTTALGSNQVPQKQQQQQQNENVQGQGQQQYEKGQDKGKKQQDGQQRQQQQQGACNIGALVTTVTVGCGQCATDNGTTVTHTVTQAAAKMKVTQAPMKGAKKPQGQGKESRVKGEQSQERSGANKNQQAEILIITRTVVKTKTVNGQCAGAQQAPAPTIIINEGCNSGERGGKSVEQAGQKESPQVPATPNLDGNGVGVKLVPLPKPAQSQVSESKPSEQPKPAQSQVSESKPSEQPKPAQSQVSESKPSEQPKPEQPSADPAKAAPAKAAPAMAAPAMDGAKAPEPEQSNPAAPAIDVSGLRLSSAVNLGSLQPGQ
ncbi:hypothetical protein HRG_010978 [Hirsutella rhossiliensis]|uniref:Uncharacterized protein n=1 Tax=Hirsutella rhossiliensis TaxID=111463 RepID=A0A9P8MMN8_9HYPO|nr:uncharacterized protein HRG_10978 [Hirsutella rhossiliensis]KAH0957885.1 hypothetical protein HRG_10978 [Hirsutella rhossiliensis]